MGRECMKGGGKFLHGGRGQRASSPSCCCYMLLYHKFITDDDNMALGIIKKEKKRISSMTRFVLSLVFFKFLC